MTYAINNNSPSVGYIAWSGVHIVFDGVDYTIANGNTNLRYVWWQKSSPAALQVSATFPTLGAEDTIVFINRAGVATSVLDSEVMDGGLVVPGTITSEGIAANAITATHILAGEIRAGKLATDAVIAGNIAASAVSARELTAKSVTAEKLVITGQGSALNDDPNFQDASAWKVSLWGTIPNFTTDSAGYNGINVAQSDTGAGTKSCTTVRPVPVSPGKTYRLSVWARKSADANGVLYLRYEYRDSSNNTGPEGYVGVEGTAVDGTWRKYSGTFTISTGYNQIAPRLLLNYSGTAGWMQAQDLRIEEVIPGELIVDGAITAAKMVAGLMQADNVLTRGLTVRRGDGTVILGAGNPLQVSDAAAGLQNTSIGINQATGAISGIGSGDGQSVANNTDSVIRAPGGGVYTSTAATQAGSLKIRLPQYFTDTMLRFTVEIYEYATGYMCTLEIGGYNYSNSGGAGGAPYWTNVSARVIGGSNVEYPVFFGHDGSKCCVWIDVPTPTTWAYPQVRVRDFFAGFNSFGRDLWATGWGIAFDTGFTNVYGTGAYQYTASVVDTLPGADWSKTARRPANVAALTGSESINNAGITLSTTGALNGAGGGQLKTLPVLDEGERETNRNFTWYNVGTTTEFKHAAAIGLSDADGYWCTLETIKQYNTGSGGFPGYQYAYQMGKTWRRQATTDAGTAFTAWVQDLDRNAYTGDLNATAGATIGTNLNGSFTQSSFDVVMNGQTLIRSGHIIDLKTTNYAEDGSAKPTAGAKLSSSGTALKVASGGFQVGGAIFTDYWFRLVQAIDGAYNGGAASRLIWRGNNDSTVRGGAPNIDCLSIFIGASSQVTAGDTAYFWFNYEIQPTSYDDNLDSMRFGEVELYPSSGAVSPILTQAFNISDRLYYSTTHTDPLNKVKGQFSVAYKPGSSVQGSTANSAYPNLFSGHLRVRMMNAYGPSAWKWFHGGGQAGTATTFGAVMTADTNAPGASPAAGGGGGSGGGGSGGLCPAPWVKIALANGRQVTAGELYDGVRLLAVNDMNLEPIPGGGTVMNLTHRWAQRIKLTLKNGRQSEWSENHRFYVVGRGWVAIQNLRNGDLIAGPEENIVDYVLATGEGQVVSFQVRGAGTYFGDGMLSHNRKVITE